MGEELEFRLPAEEMTVSGSLFSDYPTLDEMQWGTSSRFSKRRMARSGGLEVPPRSSE